MWGSTSPHSPHFLSRTRESPKTIFSNLVFLQVFSARLLVVDPLEAVHHSIVLVCSCDALVCVLVEGRLYISVDDGGNLLQLILGSLGIKSRSKKGIHSSHVQIFENHSAVTQSLT